MERVDVIVSEKSGPRARYRPRAALAGRAAAAPGEATPLVLGPLAVARILGELPQGDAEQDTRLALALASDVRAQLLDVPDVATVDTLLAAVTLLEAQLVRLRASLAGGRG